MTERLSDVSVRIGSVQQLSAVITAMRGIAAVRSREAPSRLDGVRGYARTIAEAIGQTLAYLAVRPPAATRASQSRHGIVAFCAEQGIVGTFNECVLDVAQHLMAQDPDHTSQLMLIGDRGLTSAAERELDVAWSAPMVAHPAQAASLANRIVEEVYRQFDTAQTTHITIVHAQQPLFALPPDVLLARLAEEYIFAELGEAIMLSFSAEKEARMRAVINAKSNVTRTLDELIVRSRQLRQEEITNEILELESGESEQP